MRYQGRTFDFCDMRLTDFSQEVYAFGTLWGYASFGEQFHWEYEHTRFVVTPRDLNFIGIDTRNEDGPSLFKNGIIVWDTYTDTFIYDDNQEPSFGSRYIGINDGSYYIDDYFDFNDEVGIFVCIGD